MAASLNSNANFLKPAGICPMRTANFLAASNPDLIEFAILLENVNLDFGSNKESALVYCNRDCIRDD